MVITASRGLLWTLLVRRSGAVTALRATSPFYDVASYDTIVMLDFFFKDEYLNTGE